MNYLSNTTKILSAVLLLVLILTGCSEENSSEHSPAGRQLEYTHQLEFLTAEGNSITTIDIAIADTPELRNAGLMDVHSMKSDGGMLFIFPEQQPLSFWMANTPLPLDLIFADETRQIVHIHQNAQPFAQQSIHSQYPSLYVVEVNGGFSAKHDLQVGHRIRFDAHNRILPKE